MKLDDYLRVMELSKSESEEVFNQGVFNHISLAYSVMALSNIGADNKTIDKFTAEINKCFDEYTAQEILQKIKTQ